MNVFQKRISGEAIGRNKIVEPIQLFNSLVHQDSYEYIRGVQEEFLKSWDLRRSERDIVGKLNTGAGKTLVGQLMLLSKLNENIGPAVYLCPDRQLVEQTIEQAALHSIPVVPLPNSSSGQGVNFPVEFLNNQAILVCTFERMFNGKSIFGVEGLGYRPIQGIGALVIDDAHSCIKKARKQATISFERDHPAYSSIYTIFKDSLKRQGEGALAAIEKGEASVCRLVPYWAWNQHLTTVIRLLTKLYTDSDPAIEFAWGLIGDEISKCECYISGGQIDITPLQLPLQKIPSFNNAKHRFVLSATFYDDTELLTELGISKQAIEKPIEIENRGDIGERLIIAPRRYHSDLIDDLMRGYIANYARTQNVIVLVPSKAKAKQWENFNPTIVTKDNIISATTKLKNSKGNLMIFLNRYDGLDLAADMCRILVLDGKPSAQSLRDRYVASVRTGSPIFDAQTAQTIEQGLGRAVRSGSDHCAVFILDNTLLNFLGIIKNAKFFAPSTQAQIEFGLKLFEDEEPKDAESALKEITFAVEQCLIRAREWREFHKNMILNATKTETDRSNYLEFAEIEYTALQKYRSDNNRNAAQELLNYVNEKETLSDIDKAWYYQLSAAILEPVDQVNANDLQVKAKNLCFNVLKPKAPMYSKITKTKGRQSEIIKAWLREFSNGADVIIAIENLVANFYYSPDLNSELFEDCIYQIGLFLGFSSQKPEEDEGDGPDNLWRFEDGKHLVIEAKSQKTSERVPREDIEQLLHSLSWHIDRYGESQAVIPILLHPATKSESNAHPSSGMRIMPRAKLDSFKGSLLDLGKVLGTKSPNSWTESEVHQLLSQFGLRFDLIIDKYTEQLL